MIASEIEDAALRARKEAGARVRECRLHAGMSQSELGAKIGVADTFIIALERGRVVFSADIVARLKTALPALLIGDASAKNS